MLVPATTANVFGRALFVTVTAGPAPIVTLSTAVDAVTSSPRLVALKVTVVTAALYGPTNGPPPPTGGAPAGWTKSVPVSASARAMLMRPLPVWSWVPAGSAMRARRPTMTPLLRVGSTAFMNAAAPATIAAEADVPLMTVYASPAVVVWMSVAGAAMKTLGPELLKGARASLGSVPETPMTPRSPAGNVGVLTASLPVAATRTTFFDHA